MAAIRSNRKQVSGRRASVNDLRMRREVDFGGWPTEALCLAAQTCHDDGPSDGRDQPDVLSLV
jgi:hypothetical protein